MKKISILKFEIINTIVIMILGTLLHFTYAWSNNNTLIGLISAINESTWEHLKLVYFPMVLSTIIGYIFFKEDFPNYICAKTKGILTAIMFIVIFFYTYTGILGTSIGIINILSFYLAILLGQYFSYKELKNNHNCNNCLAIITLCILFILFILFTFYPPNINLFKNPTII